MVNEISDQNIESMIHDNDEVVIDCYAEWCGPCRMLSPIIEELASENKRVTFCKINIDENEETVSKYEIMSIPTLLFFSHGKLINITIGLKSKEEIKELLKAL